MNTTAWLEVFGRDVTTEVSVEELTQEYKFCALAVRESAQVEAICRLPRIFTKNQARDIVVIGVTHHINPATFKFDIYAWGIADQQP